MLSSEPDTARLGTCAGCACACDDIEIRTSESAAPRWARTCALGDAWFAERLAPQGPVASIGGREVELEQAVSAATAILGEARLPLVFGLGHVSCEAQRCAVKIADAAGALIDPGSSPASTLAFMDHGSSTATLGDIRDRAKVVVVWRADPVATHPRLLARLGLDRAGRIGTGAEAPRRLIVVDTRRTATAEEADAFIAVPDHLNFEALWTLRALARGAALTGAVAAEVPLAQLRELLAELQRCANAAFLHAPTGAPDRLDADALALSALVRDLCRATHVVALSLRGRANAAGAEDAVAAHGGYPTPVSFALGHPTASLGEHHAARVLSDGGVDAALVVAGEELAHLPPDAIARLQTLPAIVLDGRNTTSAPWPGAVRFGTASTGIQHPGVIHRLDGVPVPLRALAVAVRPSDAEVLGAVLAGLRPAAADAGDTRDG